MRGRISMDINTIGSTILDESNSPRVLKKTLDAFVVACGEITDIRPDRGFNAWSEDSLLDNGVAINPQAAAYCAMDYDRSVAFIRGVYAAISTLKMRFPGAPLEILYAGCGPFATLLLPILGLLLPGDLRFYLLDFHQRSLDSVTRLLDQFGFCGDAIRTVRADACSYKHNGKLHLIISEAMQKSLEQEPQFAMTANLAPQLFPAGVFIPQRIDVSMCLADLNYEKELVGQAEKIDSDAVAKSAKRYPLKTVFTLLPEEAFDQMQFALISADGLRVELEPVIVVFPERDDIAEFDVAMFTHIVIFGRYRLRDYESQITLPLKCHELSPPVGGARYRVSYQLGGYPMFQFERLESA